MTKGMEDELAEHRSYLARTGFVAAKQLECLSPESKIYLDRYGFWMENLYSGTLQSFTPEQVIFVKVCKSRSGAQTPFERAFLDYLALQDKRTRVELQREADLQARKAQAEIRRQEGQAKLKQFGRQLDDYDDHQLFKLSIDHSLSSTERAMATGEWRRRVGEDTRGSTIAYAATDGQD